MYKVLKKYIIFLPLFCLSATISPIHSKHKTIPLSMVEQAKTKLLKKYPEYDLSLLHLFTETNKSAADFFEKHQPVSTPFLVTYKFNDERGMPKQVSYFGASHADEATVYALKKLLSSNSFDLGIGEYPTLGNTLNARRRLILNGKSEYGPKFEYSSFAKTIGPIFSLFRTKIEKKEELFETEVLQKTLAAKKVPVINGEQTVTKYIEDLIDAGLSYEDILAKEKFWNQTGYGAGKSGNDTTPLREKVAKWLSKVGITYNPHNTTVTSRTLRRTGEQFKNVKIKGTHTYTSDQVKNLNDISMLARDCHILKTLFESLKTYNNIIIVYGSGHFFTQKDVLEKYLGKPVSIQNYREEELIEANKHAKESVTKIKNLLTHQTFTPEDYNALATAFLSITQCISKHREIESSHEIRLLLSDNLQELYKHFTQSEDGNRFRSELQKKLILDQPFSEQNTTERQILFHIAFGILLIEEIGTTKVTDSRRYLDNVESKVKEFEKLQKEIEHHNWKKMPFSRKIADRTTSFAHWIKTNANHYSRPLATGILLTTLLKTLQSHAPKTFNALKFGSLATATVGSGLLLDNYLEETF